MKIKAISLWQPWASLIAVSAKQYETRSWATSYRGPLLICAAQRIFNLCEFSSEFREMLYELLPTTAMATLDIPFGKAVAVVDLTDCIRTGHSGISPLLYYCGRRVLSETEEAFGDFTPGRFAWKLENVRAIEPFPVEGRQRLFEVEVPEDFLNA